MTTANYNVIGKSRLWSPTKIWLLKWSKRLSDNMIRFPGAGVFVGAIGSLLSSGNPYVAIAICIMYVSIWSIALQLCMWLESQKFDRMLKLDKHVEWHEKVTVHFEHS